LVNRQSFFKLLARSRVLRFVNQGHGIAVDAAGNVYVVGYAMSDATTFPIVAGPYMTHSGLADAFVFKMNGAGSFIWYSGYIGGAGDDRAYDVAVDACALISTSSGGWPETINGTIDENKRPATTANAVPCTKE
jgi:hypothetical protein